MLELRLKPTELSIFENRSQNIYSQSKKSQYRGLSNQVTPHIFLVFQVLKFYANFTNPLLSQSSTGFSANQNSIFKKAT